MNYDELNELLKKYSSCNSSEKENDKSKSSAEENNNNNNNDNFNYGFFYTNENGFGCNDMPGGFQRLNPTLFIVIGDILGDVMSGRLPFNVQNALGNWIQLVGQAIETFSSQQQYFQSGPGRFFSPVNLNITNSTCQEATQKREGTSVSSNGNVENYSGNDSNTENEEVIKELCYIINEMRNELDEVKTRIACMEEKEK
ncbi:hypothetical protein [uncultured Clostridium sp.]|uniref:hypothetical protein n=1 Tax=uncultured Clostridium sp. TaxID=59620 RepID=UPI0025F8659E|nr:hypothetical protein [uncultured Clostridium sp.]